MTKETKEPDTKDDTITQNTEETVIVGSTIAKDNNGLEDITMKNNDKFNFEWIKEGKIFKKLLFNKRVEGFRQHVNRYEILTDHIALNVANDIL